MGQRFTAKIPSHRITPPEIFFDRRKFLSAFGIGMLATPLTVCSSMAGASQARAQSSVIDVPLRRPSVFPTKRKRGI